MMLVALLWAATEAGVFYQTDQDEPRLWEEEPVRGLLPALPGTGLMSYGISD